MNYEKDELSTQADPDMAAVWKFSKPDDTTAKSRSLDFDALIEKCERQNMSGTNCLQSNEEEARNFSARNPARYPNFRDVDETDEQHCRIGRSNAGNYDDDGRKQSRWNKQQPYRRQNMEDENGGSSFSRYGRSSNNDNDGGRGRWKFAGKRSRRNDESVDFEDCRSKYDGYGGYGHSEQPEYGTHRQKRIDEYFDGDQFDDGYGNSIRPGRFGETSNSSRYDARFENAESSRRRVEDYEEYPSSPPRKRQESRGSSMYRNATGSVARLANLYSQPSDKTLGFTTKKPFKPPVPGLNNEPNETDVNVSSSTGSPLQSISKNVCTNNKKSDDNEEYKKLMDLIESEILESSKLKIKWEDIAGLDGVKKTIREIVVWPMLRPDLFTGLRSPPKGLLLYGPPGTGKTMIGRCIASQANATFYSISASSLTSKWVGESEKLVRALFESARSRQPAVVFVDEVDALLSTRVDGEHESSRRLKTQFLTELDGARTYEDERILVVGATNRPQDIDDAARRRFTKRLYVPLPDYDGRLDMLQKVLRVESHELTVENFRLIAEKTQGFSCDDLKKLCKEAALGPLRRLADINIATLEQLPPITEEDFHGALSVIRSSVDTEQLRKYEDFDNRFGSGGFSIA